MPVVVPSKRRGVIGAMTKVNRGIEISTESLIGPGGNEGKENGRSHSAARESTSSLLKTGPKSGKPLDRISSQNRL